MTKLLFYISNEKRNNEFLLLIIVNSINKFKKINKNYQLYFLCLTNKLPIIF